MLAIKGAWGAAEIAEYLDDVRIPVRLSVVADSGYPMVVSLWFLVDGGALWCATSADSRLVQALKRNPKCGFEIAADTPPYHGVRGQGLASLNTDDDRAMLSRLIQHYLGDEQSPLARWLLGRDGEEISIRIDPTRIMSWDYRARMAKE